MCLEPTKTQMFLKNSPDFGLWQVKLPPAKNAGLPRLTLMRDATVMFL
jgi:hypothetical protein